MDGKPLANVGTGVQEVGHDAKSSFRNLSDAYTKQKLFFSPSRPQTHKPRGSERPFSETWDLICEIIDRFLYFAIRRPRIYDAAILSRASRTVGLRDALASWRRLGLLILGDGCFMNTAPTSIGVFSPFASDLQRAESRANSGGFRVELYSSFHWNSARDGSSAEKPCERKGGEKSRRVAVGIMLVFFFVLNILRNWERSRCTFHCTRSFFCQIWRCEVESAINKRKKNETHERWNWRK